MANKDIPTEEIQHLLRTLHDDIVKEDVAVRERQIRQWRRLKLLWEGFQRIWFSEVAHDWRIWDEMQDMDSDQNFYDKPINVFKAYLESIIAALSVTVPAIKCFPDNADDTLDLATARAGDKICQLIYRHNNAPLLWLHALFIFVTEGMTACYTYTDEDEKYGTYTEEQTEDVEEEHQVTSCPKCGFQIDSTPVQPGMENQGQAPDPGLSNEERDEYDPENHDAEIQYELNQGSDLCPACMQMMDPEIKNEKFIVTRIVGRTTKAKSRICMEAYGGLYVKIPNYAKCPADLPYLTLSYEKDYSLVVEEFDHLHGNKNLRKYLKNGPESPGGYSQYAQWGRLSPQYQGEYPLNVVTVCHEWIRPGKFNFLQDEDDVKKLKKLYPNGVKVTWVNEEFACACNESLDDHWTILNNPLSDYLHFDPAGQNLVSVQEITNDLISLVLQTIEHGIGQTFADSRVLNFNAYEQTETTPGGIFPATPTSGKSLSDAFHEIKTATLSGEVMPFSESIQSFGQLVSGALPSLFGGNLGEGASQTASQYSMSRAQALQRLQNNWKMFTFWWKEIFGKVIPAYIKEVREDERDVQRDNKGNFVNVFIRKAELEGKIGKVELDANENLPMTWGQIKDTVEKLLTNQNPLIQKMLASPENLPIIYDSLGLTDFFVPGEADVERYDDVIKELLNSAPQVGMDPMSGQPINHPSVEIDPTIDQFDVGYDIVRNFLVSEAGRQAKIDNPQGYENVLLYCKGLFQQIQQNMMNQQMAAQGANGAPPPAKPNTPMTKEAPIMGESDVHSIQ